MRIAKSSLAWISCLLWLFFVPVSFAENSLVLADGTRAAVEGKNLILIGRDSRRSVAPVGIYRTLDGRYAIIVKENEVVIRDLTKKLPQ